MRFMRVKLRSQHEVSRIIRRITEIVTLCRPPPHQDWGRARTAGSRFARYDKEPGPSWGSNYPENGLVKPPRRDTRALRRNTRALSPAGMFGRKVPLRLAAQKSRLHAPSVLMRSAPAYFLCKWGVLNYNALSPRPKLNI
jgi:hypothetical protein